ncbi:hypothetical protein [Polymorphobacter sp.]|uniref:hypothetical protein n=1 Tax=Polymorphobacter sp. TaxID=1909290 RepID=UPI003F70EECF
MMRLLKATVLAAPLLLAPLLTACETPDPDFGYSVRRNGVLQVVNMQPVYAGVPMEGGDAVRATDAQRRYLRGQSKTLLKVDGKSGIGEQGGATDTGTGGTGRTAGN